MNGNNVALDANAAIAFINGNQKLSSLKAPGSRLFIPAAAVGELLFGVVNSGKPVENRQRLDRLLSAVTVLEITAATAEYYASLRHALKLKGKPTPSTTSGSPPPARSTNYLGSPTTLTSRTSTACN